MVKKYNITHKISFVFILLLAFSFGLPNKFVFSASPSEGGVYNGYEEPDDDFDWGFDDDCDCDDDNNDDEPDASTKSASSVRETSAVLNARVDGNGSSTKVWFEYGRNRDLNEDTGKESMGSGTKNIDVRISGLKKDTIYYFRVVARNDEGTDYGSVMSFRTDEDGNDDEDEIILNQKSSTLPPINQFFFTNTTTPKKTTPATTEIPEKIAPETNTAPETSAPKEETKVDSVGSSLAANVLGFNFFPTTLLGWLAFVIFILTLYILGRKYLFPSPHSETIIVESHGHH